MKTLAVTYRKDILEITGPLLIFIIDGESILE